MPSRDCCRCVGGDGRASAHAGSRTRARQRRRGHAGFLTYEHAGPPVDFVCTRNALHQIPDFWKAIALDRIHGLLKPGGILLVRDLVYDFEPSEADARMAAWFAGAADDPARGWTAAELAEHVRTEHSTFTTSR